MSPTRNAWLPFDADPDPVESRIDARDRDGRERAVDPRFNVALEASAGTGKTRVLVHRYVNLLHAGVEPSNILAMTFTRKAAAEMRARILDTLRVAAMRGEIPASRWRELRDRAGDIAIGTIDAFCLSLLREFPLEADLDPAFTVAEDTDVPRLVDEALDRALRVCRGLARDDEQVALVFAQLGDRRVRGGLAALLARRIAAPDILRRYLGRSRRELTIAAAADRAAEALLDVFAEMVRLKPDTTTGNADVDVVSGFSRIQTDGLRVFAACGPADPVFMLLLRQLEALDTARRTGSSPDPVLVQIACTRARDYFLTQDGAPRSRLTSSKAQFPSHTHWARHRDLVVGHAARVAEVLSGYRRDLNALVARGVWRMYRVAEAEYRRTLDAHAVLDFSDLLLKTLELLRRMEEFSRSRYRLESRYHHVLLDEFQDTSRAQWELVSLLVQAWGEGAGLSSGAPLPPSIFIVGDRKQSIYGFRDADVSVLADAARYLEGLRPDRDVRRSISRSFRAVPGLLSFVNDVCHDLEKAPERDDRFRYEEADRFPIDAVGGDAGEILGAVLADSVESCAEGVAGEVARLLASGATVRDVGTGVPRAVRAGDVAVLFRTRDSHRELEAALERHGVRAYVYKGLGFFDSDEIRDVLALLWHLADPLSNLRAAAWMRSGFVRLSDEALRRLAPRLSDALISDAPLATATSLDGPDAEALTLARAASSRWRRLVDHVPPAELLDLVLAESAYALELRGPRFRQALENIKKIRGLIRRVQNNGYATLDRIVAHLDRLALGDESNAAIDALDAVSLMTVHAAKGLEFPIVFLVNLTRGTGSRRPPIRVSGGSDADLSVSVGDFQSGSDDDQAAREREETKRLLYVALTRARDRLYLSAITSDGRLQPGRGSLAEVLPASLLARLGPVAGSPIRWKASSGVEHALRVCEVHSTGEAALDVEPKETPPPVAPVESDFGLGSGLESALSSRSGPATETSAAGRGQTVKKARIQDLTPWRWADAGVDADRLRGRLVHRLLERIGLTEAWEGSALPDVAAGLIRPDERAGEIDLNGVIAHACAVYRTLSRRADLREVFRDGQASYEVPFCLVIDGSPVRGTIDCLIWTTASDSPSDAQARVTVLEFKTGPPRAGHREQAALYRRAAEALFPGARVEAQLVYPAGLEQV